MPEQLANLGLPKIFEWILSGNIISFGFYETPPPNAIRLPISIDIPKVENKTPFFLFEQKLLDIPLKFYIELR